MQGISELPGASNRQIADYAGIQDQGQVSKLLARLQRLGLITNASGGHLKGEPNAWALTALGQQVAGRLGVDRDGGAGAGLGMGRAPTGGDAGGRSPSSTPAARSRDTERRGSGSRRRQTRRSR
jgi:hypothetical protein